MMKPLFAHPSRLVAGLIATLLLASCGQTGPLTLPKKTGDNTAYTAPA